MSSILLKNVKCHVGPSKCVLVKIQIQPIIIISVKISKDQGNSSDINEYNDLITCMERDKFYLSLPS